MFSCIRTEYRKIRTRKISGFGHFSRSESYTADVISTVVHITLTEDCTLQKQNELKPINWKKGFSEKEIQKKMFHCRMTKYKI